MNFDEIKKKTYFVVEGTQVYKCHVYDWYYDSKNQPCFRVQSNLCSYGSKYLHELFTDEASAIIKAIENTQNRIQELRLYLDELENQLNKIDLEDDAC